MAKFTGAGVASATTNFIGSWNFVLLSIAAISFWLLLNGEVFPHLGLTPFDPKPYGVLNLFLSCFAALQASIVMISQRQQEDIAKETLKAILVLSRSNQLMLKDHGEQLEHILHEIEEDNQ